MVTQNMCFISTNIPLIYNNRHANKQCVTVNSGN